MKTCHATRSRPFGPGVVRCGRAPGHTGRHRGRYVTVDGHKGEVMWGPKDTELTPEEARLG